MKTNTFRMTEMYDDERPAPLIVIHPLDDAPEEKLNTTGVAPLHLTTGGKLSLMALRGYLILMTILLLYHVLELGGLFHRWKR